MPIVETASAPATVPAGSGSAAPSARAENDVASLLLRLMNMDIKKAIRSAQSSSQIRRVSMETSGLVALIEDGIAKAPLGQTTISEVLKNLPRIEKPRPIPELFRLTGLRS